MSKIRILIADDHALVREGIAAFLRFCNDMETVAEASDGIEAVEQFRKYKPDIILMDIAMPRMGGLEATLEIKKLDPAARILILTQYDDKEYISRFLKAGVSGYLLKKAVGSDLVSAIRAVNRGEFYLFSAVATEVVYGYLGKGVVGEDPYEKLSDREKQVLKPLAEGYTHKEIADMLNISVKTVIAHQTNICEKLDIHSRAGLIKFAIQQGIIKIDSMPPF
ncbi:MAG: response regulator transcription factor [Alphaproteobacteria bacterium]|uniref:Response regulator transcription factor n=1 Tax=Candidatus Nitrobium versatile TaxID=2884831 RepID=A0A953M370_9BACT|nr:response regulator transcription factor [Candidatus Nitrobium versatile]